MWSLIEFAIGCEQIKSWRNDNWMVEPAQYRLTMGPDSASGQTVEMEIK